MAGNCTCYLAAILCHPGPEDSKELVQSILHRQGKLFKEVIEIKKNSIRNRTSDFVK